MTAIMPIPGMQNPWEHPLTEGNPAPLSERLIRALEAHMAAESEDATRASQFADASRDPALNVLLELIVEDANRHRKLLERMVRRLRQELDFTDAPQALPVPVANANAFAGAEEALGNLRALIRNERESARYLRHLGRQDSELYGGFFALLVETFARDAEKHVHLLRYVLRQAEAQRAVATETQSQPRALLPGRSRLAEPVEPPRPLGVRR